MNFIKLLKAFCNKKINFYLILFGLVNLIQSIFTITISDENYYWVYSNELDWGYFDHPPLIAVFIKLGSLIFKSELGVRLITVIASTLSFITVWHLIPEKNRAYKHADTLYLLILLAIPGFHIYSFISTPDVPLILFFSLYLLALKRFRTNQNFLNILYLGICSALLIYSKYHGGLFIILSILCDPSLLKKRGLYLSGILALLLIIPHLFWQYKNDFPTFNYHLFERVGSKGFELSTFLTRYILGSLGILNPGLLILMIVALLKNISSPLKDIKFMFRLFNAIMVFFIFYSFRSKIEAHWVVCAFIPMTLVLHDWVITSPKRLKVIQFISIPSIFMIFVLRLCIGLSGKYYENISKTLLPSSVYEDFNKRNQKDYFKIDSIAIKQNAIAIFQNSYQDASNYSFFTKKPSLSLNTMYGRLNQYEIGGYEDYINNKKAILITGGFHFYEERTTKDVKYKILDKFLAVSKISTKITSSISSLNPKKEVLFSIDITNPYPYNIYFNSKPSLKLLLLFKNGLNKRYVVPLTPMEEFNEVKAHNVLNIKLQADIKDIPKGMYKLKVFIQQEGLAPQRTKGYNQTARVN